MYALGYFQKIFLDTEQFNAQFNSISNFNTQKIDLFILSA